MATIKRSAKGMRRAARASNRASKARRAKAQTSGIFDSIMRALPFTEEQWHRFFLFAILAGALALAWFVASLAGLPQVARAHWSALAADTGFEVRHVRVTGVERMDERRVYERALTQREIPMPEVDLEALRADLVALDWVRDARVSRQLPATLAIDIVERQPHAVLQKPDRLVLIDVEGTELETVSAERAADMLLVSGPGAARQVAGLDRLLDAAPALRPQVAKAEWVGNRRWNLTFRTDQVLALPQGDEEAASALIQFARMDGQNRLLGGEVATFDMRAPPRVYMRIPGRADRVLGEQEEGS